MASVTHSFDLHQKRERRPIRKGHPGYVDPDEESTDEGSTEGDVNSDASEEEVEHVKSFTDRVSG